MLFLVDTHAHIHDPVYEEERSAVLARAWEAGVRRIITIGTDAVTSAAAVTVAEMYGRVLSAGTAPDVYATVGIDPYDAASATPAALAEIVTLARHPRVVAIGEIGLDYYWDRASHEMQHDLFRHQLELAATMGKPVVIHNRDADADTEAVLLAWSTSHPWRVEPESAFQGETRPLGVMHCFSGSVEMAQRLYAAGFLISLAGPVTFKNGKKSVALVEALPLAALVLETDSPFLAPHPFRGQQNEPAYVRLIAARIAELKNVSLAEVAESTTRNACRLFGWEAAGLGYASRSMEPE
ncbi:MAG: TatD family deoxyribonuclease [Chloroflexi bacterium]|nr:TatD family deoxyribonuclease [Chloroflexota bacterium]